MIGIDPFDDIQVRLWRYSIDYIYLPNWFSIRTISVLVDEQINVIQHSNSKINVYQSKTLPTGHSCYLQEQAMRQ